MAYKDDPLAIPGPQRSKRDSGPADTSIGPPSVGNAPASPTIPGPTRITFNPTGTDLSQAGALRPESGPYSASNPAPLIDPSGSLVTAAAVPSRPSVAASATPAPPSGPAPVLAAVTPETALNRNELAAAGLTRPNAPTATPAPAGPRVFSDGSGTGAIPATLTRPQIDALQNGNRLSRADAGVGGNVSSEALGSTPVLGSADGLALSRPTPRGPDPVTRALAINAQAQQDASSDVASIANRDFRSPLGAAARDAQVEHDSAETRIGPPGKNPNDYQSAISALYNTATAPLAATSKIADESVQDAGATTREGMKSAADLAVERLRAGTQKPDTVNLADGTLGIVRPDGTVATATDAKGNPVRPQVGKPPVDSAAYGKFVDSATSRYLGADPITGMVTGSDGKPRQPTAEEYTKASRAAKALADETFQNTSASAPAAASANPARPTSLDDFKTRAKKLNPNATDDQLEAYYKANYGT